MTEFSAIDLALQRVRQGSVEGMADSSLASYDAAWAALAMSVEGAPGPVRVSLWEYLARWQSDDGRVVVDPSMPAVYWPTALAVLAWRGSEQYAMHRHRAVQFLRTESGTHWARIEGDVSAHDPSIRGWSWLGGTHSWVEPTSLAIIALKTVGEGSHPRVVEAVRMLLDRQLSTGGWNCGNTAVFGTALRPIPEDTGHALAALAGSVEREQVEQSVRYLGAATKTARTPGTLAWALNGLSAWTQRPPQARPWVLESLARQHRVGVYGIRLLSQLVVSYFATQGLVAWAKDDE